jgi:hypothetical protein
MELVSERVSEWVSEVIALHSYAFFICISLNTWSNIVSLNEFSILYQVLFFSDKSFYRQR